MGRGPLAGPVVAATAFLKFDDFSKISRLLSDLQGIGITDSKKLTAKKRLKILQLLGVEVDSLAPGEKYLLREESSFTLSFSISEVSPTKIDEINILNASLLGMADSFICCHDGEAGILLIDGNKTPAGLPDIILAETIVKGDSKSVLIGLASVIAKEYRDGLMTRLGEKYPGYGLESHAGYPTVAHKAAIVKLGVTPIHRRSFRGVKEHV